MPTTYNVIEGDTFDIIARKLYGDDLDSAKIESANPGVSEPLQAGTILSIPTNTTTPRNKQQRANFNNINEVALLINNDRFRFWDRIRITRAIDTIDTVEFSSVFESDSKDFKAKFKPFSFNPILITVGGDVIFTGNMISVNPVIENKSKIVSVSGYSTPGILNDCTSPASAFPLEFNDQILTEIVRKLVEPFGITSVFNSSPGPKFDRVSSTPGKKVLSFIINLAKQRGLLVSSSPAGDLIIQNSAINILPVAKLEQGFSPLLSVMPFFSPQEYYSHITGIEPVLVGLAGSQFTVKNPQLPGVTRPFTFTAPDTLDSDLKTAVEAKAGRMFANVVSYVITVNTWRDTSGVLWEPNTVISLLAQDAMIYTTYDFLIRSVIFEKDNKTEKATINLVIPGSFNGDLPKNMPWDD